MRNLIVMQKITSFIWFDTRAEEAAQFYTSLFKNSKTGRITRYIEEGREIHGMEPGSVMTIDFTLGGYSFTALNGGPHYTPNPSISFFVMCETEEEINHMWQKLNREGETLMPLDTYEWSDKYGWTRDRYGISWQLALGKTEDTGGQMITPCLFFTGDQYCRAEEAIHFYTSVFRNSDVDGILRYDGKESTDAAGMIKHAQIRLEGETFMIMESATEQSYGFSEGTSLVVHCTSADEVDYFWEKLTDGGDPAAQQCGWLKDKFGVSWQVVPTELFEMLRNENPEKVRRVTSALMKMKKLDINILRSEFEEATPPTFRSAERSEAP
jgi:predicted 3-demethylubiquinone-9 3-methyltransferase (glyoxalase superfamily)